MKKPLFVIQKHHASTLHYDFRLQVGNILKSWVIPKGPSLDPKNKRLAILTEDHHLDFADFEGEIPAGQYGAGKVIVWDRGSYENITTKNGKPISMDEAFEMGEIIISLQGEKLKGKFTLVLMKKQDEPKNWLLIKQDDPYAEDQFDPVTELPNSIISNKSVDEI
jgi:DNA ligase D-like protein (predicted 3'-phosphoesterase)